MLGEPTVEVGADCEIDFRGGGSIERFTACSCA